MSKEITVTKKLDNGDVVERVVSTPNEIVQAEFDGWTEKKTSSGGSKSSSDGDGKHVTTK